MTESKEADAEYGKKLREEERQRANKMVEKRMETLGKEAARWVKSCGPIAATTEQLQPNHFAAMLKAFSDKIGGCDGKSALVGYICLQEVCAGIERALKASGIEVPKREQVSPKGAH